VPWPPNSTPIGIGVGHAEEILKRRNHNLGGLTAREHEILAPLADGLSAPQIAQRLCLGLSTIKTHLQAARAENRSRSDGRFRPHVGRG
jgi:DNA-binding CsgD family transcriptional regulator